MADHGEILDRRRFLKASAASAAGLAAASSLTAAQTQPAPSPEQALVAITMDLEMARNFPHWEDTHWDYEKGNLNDDAKRYAVSAARRVKDKGGVIHFFLVGGALEQENVDWLKGIIKSGHPVGNHTYDHVYVLARKNEDVQFRFARCPWLLEGQTPEQAIEENIRLCTAAMRNRLGIAPVGFRTPGGFAEGLNGREDVQRMLLRLGFKWVSCRYPAHPMRERAQTDPATLFEGIIAAQKAAQPFVYPTGLIDVPMTPISDIVAFRTCRWTLPDFQKCTRLALEHAIENRLTFNFLCHPSCLGVLDPEFKTIDMICDLVADSRGGAILADDTTLAQRASKA